MSDNWDVGILGSRPEAEARDWSGGDFVPAGFAQPQKRFSMRIKLAICGGVLAMLVALALVVIGYFGVMRPNFEVTDVTVGVEMGQLAQVEFSPSGSEYILLTEGDKVDIGTGFDETGVMMLYSCESSNENVVKVEGQRISAVGGGVSEVTCSTDWTEVESNLINVEVIGK